MNCPKPHSFKVENPEFELSLLTTDEDFQTESAQRAMVQKSFWPQEGIQRTCINYLQQSRHEGECNSALSPSFSSHTPLRHENPHMKCGNIGANP